MSIYPNEELYKTNLNGDSRIFEIGALILLSLILSPFIIKDMYRFYYRFIFRTTLPFIFAFGKNKGVGKSTLARSLRYFFGGQEICFADPIKKIAKILFGLTEEQVTDEKLKEIIIPRLGVSPRTILQRLGTELGRDFLPKLFPEIPLHFDNIWIDIFHRQAIEYKKQGVNFIWNHDTRFPDEARYLKSVYGVYTEIERPSLYRFVPLHKQISDLTQKHTSETQDLSMYKNHTIINNRSLLALKSQGYDIVQETIKLRV